MICTECQKPIYLWDKSYLDESGSPKYYSETKGKGFIERLPLCGPECSLEYWKKQNNEN